MKRDIKNVSQSYVRACREFLQHSSHVNSKPLILAENDESDFDEFLDLIIYYMCARCGSDIHKTYPRSTEWVEHHHNGLFTISLGQNKINDLYSGIMNSYRVYLEKKENPVNLERPLAQAFFDLTAPLTPNDNLHRTIRYFFLNRHNNFIRHGLEKLQKSEYKIGQSFPPKFSMQEVSLATDGVTFAIELDRPPFTRCFSHGSGWQWHYCGGVISVNDFKRMGGKFNLSGDRDHFYARSDIELSNWYFLYRTKTERTKNPKFSLDLMRSTIQGIKSSGAGHIEINTLNKFFTAVNMLEQRIEVFGVL